jgi:NADH:ubiquinone oxidoreductase subunit 6 (subunit J)
MFDVQVLRHRDGHVPQPVLTSIAAYYRRVTVEARPLTWLVAVVMAGTIAATGAEIVRDDMSKGSAWASFALAVSAIGLAMLHTFPSAVRLATAVLDRNETAADARQAQSRLARSICRDHLLCLAAIGLLLAIQLRAAA